MGTRRRATGRRITVIACRTYLGTWMEPNRFRTASVALAVATTATGAAVGAVIALPGGTPLGTGANLGILVTTGVTSLMLATMLVIMLTARRSGRSPDDLIADRPAPARRSADRPGLPANAVRPVAPRPPDPLVPLALPVFFALLAALLLGEALWTTDGVSYWWAGGSCLAAATLTEVWRETGRHTDRAVH